VFFFNIILDVHVVITVGIIVGEDFFSDPFNGWAIPRSVTDIITWDFTSDEFWEEFTVFRSPPVFIIN